MVKYIFLGSPFPSLLILPECTFQVPLFQLVICDPSADHFARQLHHDLTDLTPDRAVVSELTHVQLLTSPGGLATQVPRIGRHQEAQAGLVPEVLGGQGGEINTMPRCREIRIR